MKVTLLTHTPNPEKVVESAARQCYSSLGAQQIYNKSSKPAEFLKHIPTTHASFIEHASFTFAIEGISRACSHQLVRHRIASYSQQSQRYVSAENFEYVIPQSIINVGLKEWYEAAMQQMNEWYEFVLDKLSQSGLKKKTAQQDARFLLPNAMATKIVVTMNARSLLHFFEVRLCERAQWEIRELAQKMLDLVKPIAPTIFRNAGPLCEQIGKCPEGVMACENVAIHLEK